MVAEKASTHFWETFLETAKSGIMKWCIRRWELWEEYTQITWIGKWNNANCRRIAEEREAEDNWKRAEKMEKHKDKGRFLEFGLRTAITEEN